ncbi:MULTISPECIES: ADP-ribosylglycohydrolase family protein [Prauserella salsuginis group]|uniref:ADP-ribosylglycohydrolase family protein n=1 Tax=Prauserella salsuginis TaxID=387889 RepID=A0ABW6G4R2_9PSEU|nr:MULTISPECIES: ADP-ribosylglycohydrolase family protein [Prauserella salsuginis group]MCR3718745.1 ADP-ribosylglycohydrolase [Prauserella flava]MCR3733315.1 ADP-ribosylglycohydrolase [Prauserella salsuginis]
MSGAGVRDRALGAFEGLALGDALGMPTQSLSRESIATYYGRLEGLRDAVEHQPISPGLPAGTVTDDTEQAVLVARLLIEGRGRIEPHAFARALLDWEADMIRRNLADLLGPSTKRALELLESGAAPDEAGRTGTTNGAAMRITPVAIATKPDVDPLLDAVVSASRLTHNTSLGISAAAAVAAAVSAGIDGADLGPAMDHAERVASEGAARAPWVAGGEIASRIRWARGWVRELDAEALPAAIAEVIGTSVAAQESVVAAFALAEALGDRPLDALTLAARLGGDTDTVAAICGAVLGSRHGASGLPADLTAVVRKVNDLDLGDVTEGLLELRNS